MPNIAQELSIRTEQLLFKKYIIHNTIKTNQSSGMHHL